MSETGQPLGAEKIIGELKRAGIHFGDDKANASLTKRFQNGLQEPDETLNPLTVSIFLER